MCVWKGHYGHWHVKKKESTAVNLESLIVFATIHREEYRRADSGAAQCNVHSSVQQWATLSSSFKHMLGFLLAWWRSSHCEKSSLYAPTPLVTVAKKSDTCSVYIPVELNFLEEIYFDNQVGGHVVTYAISLSLHLLTRYMTVCVMDFLSILISYATWSSGKQPHNYGKSPCLNHGKSTISTGPFSSSQTSSTGRSMSEAKRWPLLRRCCGTPRQHHLDAYQVEQLMVPSPSCGAISYVYIYVYIYTC